MMFYGFDNTYGVGSRIDCGGGVSRRAGLLHVFHSSSARSEWVSSEVVVSGPVCREVVSSREAREFLVDVIGREAFRIDFDRLGVSFSEIRNWTMKDLVRVASACDLVYLHVDSDVSVL